MYIVYNTERFQNVDTFHGLIQYARRVEVVFFDENNAK